MSTRVVIADDEAMIRAGFAMILDAQPDIEVVGEVADGDAAVTAALELRPDVIVMDIQMPRLSGIEATRAVRQGEARARVLIVTTFDVDEYVYSALQAGASGFLLKNAPPEDLVRAVRVIADGEALVAPTVTRRLIEQFCRQPSTPPGDARPVASLTQREAEVLQLVAKGMSNQQIADALFIGRGTVKTHVAGILAKLCLGDRTQAVVYAYENGIVVPGVS